MHSGDNYGIFRIREEMQNLSNTSLIDAGQDSVTLSLANLILTGVATPFLHNGIITDRVIDVDVEDYEEKRGINERFHQEMI